MRIRAPLGARPAATVEGSSHSRSDDQDVDGFLVGHGLCVRSGARSQIEQHRLVEVEGEGVVLADAHLGVSHIRAVSSLPAARDDDVLRPSRLNDLYLGLEGGD